MGQNTGHSWVKWLYGASYPPLSCSFCAQPLPAFPLETD